MKTFLLFVLLLALAVGCQPLPTPSTPSLAAPSSSPSPQPPVSPVSKVVEVYDFFASWCGPCRRLSPTFDLWKTKYSSSSVTFLKVNVDLQRDLASKYNIQTIPTVVVTQDGKEVKRWVGGPTEAELVPYLK